MRHGRVGALLLAAVLAAVGLAACGGGGSSTSTPVASVVTTPATPPTATAPASTTTATTPTTAAPTATAKPAETTPRPSTSTSTSSSSSSGGGAASFRASSGDNSIPDYGSEAPGSERARASAALAAFLHARAGGAWEQACIYLAGATRHQLEKFAVLSKGKVKGCGPVLAALSKGPTAARADTLTGGVAALRIKGKSAFALFHGPKGSKYVMPMVNEGGAWKMSQLAPVAYPLGSAGAAP